MAMTLRKPSSPARSAKKTKPVIAWAGYIGGKLDSWIECDEYDYGDQTHCRLSIYRTREDAKKRYEDCRRVLVTPAPAPQRRKK